MSKTERFELRLTQEHKEKLIKKANQFGMSLGDYLTMVGLSAQIDIRVGVSPLLVQVQAAKDLLEDELINRDEFNKIKSAIFKGEGYKALASKGAIR